MRKRPKGVTLVELVIVIVITGILASAFSVVFVPSMNMLFYFPQSARVNAAAADLVQIIIEGDDKAKGLRFTGPPCAVGGGGGGGSTITVATASTLTYNYVDADYCGGAAARTSHTVALAYDSGTGTVTRAIDGAAAQNIPYYVTSGGEIDFSVPGGGTDLFHYFDDIPADLGATPTVTDITRVDIDVIASSGSGQVEHNAGQIRIKSGVEIKRYTT